MNGQSVKLCRIAFFLTFMVQLCCCAPSVHRKTTPAQGRSELALPKVSCSVRGIKAVFGPQVKSNVHVRDMTGDPIPVPRSEESCGVKMKKKNQSLTFFSRYDGCYTQFEGRTVVIPLQVQLKGKDRWLRVNISCPLIKRRDEKTLQTPAPFLRDCDTERALQVDCGPRGVSSDACYKLGCCYDDQNSTCYHRLNDCSLDGHFVFSVKATDTHTPIDPSSLIIKDQPQCSPAVTTSDTAVFKIRVMDCGAKMTKDGDVVTYEVEVEELNTKHSPFSLQVQCEYAASDLQRATDLRSLFPVTNPAPVVALGTIRVQMRIATDASFTSFVPEHQLPLTSPLGKALNVEVSIVQPSPDPTLSLRVRDCFAYPVSRHSVWTLLYDGCPNPVDNMRSSVPVDKQGEVTSHSQSRRFDVKTFAFLDPLTGHPSVEEMYFYCWVEICTEDVDCAQSCTIVSSDGDRQRRDAISESHQLQLVSAGPIIQKTEQEDKRNTMFQVMVYILSGACAALLLILLFIVWSRCHKTKEPQACDTQVNKGPQ